MSPRRLPPPRLLCEGPVPCGRPGFATRPAQPVAASGVTQSDRDAETLKRAFTSGFMVFPIAFRGRLATVRSRCGTL